MFRLKVLWLEPFCLRHRFHLRLVLQLLKILVRFLVDILLNFVQLLSLRLGLLVILQYFWGYFIQFIEV